jgi:AAA15 family ATPase/GTPase
MAKTETPYRFAWLRLKNWKNFQSVEVDLPLRVFLVGPNASGKSNLLDVFRFLRDLVIAWRWFSGSDRTPTWGQSVTLFSCTPRP